MCLSWFSPHYKAYLWLNRQTSQIYVSCFVVFNKFFFPLSSSLSSPSFPSPSSMFIPNFLISSFPFPFLLQPLHIPFLSYLVFSSSFSSTFLHSSTFPLSSSSLSSHFTPLSPHFSKDTHPTTSVHPFHLLYLLTFKSLFSITSHIPLTLIPWWLDPRLGFINKKLLW